MNPSRGPRVFHFCSEARVSAVSATPLPPPPLFSRSLELGEELLARVEGGVPDLRTERAEKPASPASDPSTGRGLLWTGTSAGGALAQDGDWSNHPSLGFGRDDDVRSWNHPALGQPHDTTHDHVDHAGNQ